MPPDIRPARAQDIDALVRIENEAFSSDRISRRSFRQLIERETAETLVAECDGEIVGYCMILFRQGSAVARLYSIAIAPGRAGGGLGRRLLEEAETAAFEHDCLVLRLEVRADNRPAIALYERNAYRHIGMEPDYYEDGEPALRYEKMLRGATPFVSTVPFYEQTTEFTCGPCCLMMAMAHFDPTFEPSALMEVRLWREATTIFMMSGPGGCEPFGLAVAARDNGLDAEIIVSTAGPLFLQSVRSVDKRRVMELAQADFRSRAEAHAIPVLFRAFGLSDIRAAIAEGKLVVVLVSGFLMFGQKVPHWLLAIGDDGEHIIVHDPWVEEAQRETRVDAAAIPIPHDVFMRMAQFGKRLRAAVILGKRQDG